MNLKTFQASSMPEALQRVKQELGRDAVILHTRTVRRGGWFGLGGREVVEVTASNDVNVMPRSRSNGSGHGQPRAPGGGSSGGARAGTGRSLGVVGQGGETAGAHAGGTRGGATGAAGGAASGGASGGALLDRVYGRSNAPAVGGVGSAATAGPRSGSGRGDPGAPEPAGAPHRADGSPASSDPSEPSAQPARQPGAEDPFQAAQTPQAAQASQASQSSALDEEVRQIRSMVHRMMRQQAGKTRTDLPDELFNQYLALLEQEVTEELAEEVIERVKGSLTKEQLGRDEAVREAIGEAIAGLIPEEPEPWEVERAKDGRPLTIALTGPTGVGKTTTLAKLAATYKLRQGKRVALVTIDTYRIAAVDQLRTYANIIDLPLHVVLTTEELREVMKRCAQYDVVLIDTAGRSQRDDEKLEHLRQAMEVADPHEIHLVLSSTCSQRVLMEAVERFSRVRIDRVIFTKLDEAVNFGVLLNVARRVNKRLSYLTTGQDVPHQIEAGRSHRLAELILGEDV